MLNKEEQRLLIHMVIEFGVRNEDEMKDKKFRVQSPITESRFTILYSMEDLTC